MIIRQQHNRTPRRTRQTQLGRHLRRSHRQLRRLPPDQRFLRSRHTSRTLGRSVLRSHNQQTIIRNQRALAIRRLVRGGSRRRVVRLHQVIEVSVRSGLLIRDNVRAVLVLGQTALTAGEWRAGRGLLSAVRLVGRI